MVTSVEMISGTGIGGTRFVGKWALVDAGMVETRVYITGRVNCGALGVYASTPSVVVTTSWRVFFATSSEEPATADVCCYAEL